jgi:hypothetical protein
LKVAAVQMVSVAPSGQFLTGAMSLPFFFGFDPRLAATYCFIRFSLVSGRHLPVSAGDHRCLLPFGWLLPRRGDALPQILSIGDWSGR